MTQTAPIHVVQITDCHLFEEVSGSLLGMNTQDSLERVLKLVKKQSPRDVVLCTGDLVQDASIDGYARFKNMIDDLGAPQYWIPGNHDINATMNVAAQGTSIMRSVVMIGNWQIILLDSTIEGAVPGHITDESLAFLDQALRHRFQCT